MAARTAMTEWRGRLDKKPHRTPQTPAQQRVYAAYLALYAEQSSLPPTVREIAARAGISMSTTQRHIESLIERGWLRRVGPGLSRGLVLTEDVA